jgi:glutamate dehydrogenase
VAQQRSTIEQVVDALAASDHPAVETLVAFARTVTRRVPAHLLTLPPAELAARLRRTFDALREGPPDEPLVRLTPGRADVEVGDGSSATAAATLEVVAADRPFLLSTVRAELEASDLTVTGSFHPILGVERDPQGRLVHVGPARTATRQETFFQLEVRGPAEALQAPDLLDRVHDRLAAVRRVTDDHPAMRAVLETLAGQLEQDPEDGSPRIAELLRWLLDDNLVLLGTLDTATGDRLGLLRGDAPGKLTAMPASDDAPLRVSRTPERSPVQRQAPVEVFDVARPQPDGGRVVVLGLLTRKGTAEPAVATPLLRDRLRTVFEREDVVDGSYEAITLMALFQALPKDELFRCSPDELHELLVTLLVAEEQLLPRVVVRPHEPSRTVSVLVAVPRDRWDTGLQAAFTEHLRTAFDAERLEAEVAVDDREEALARFLVGPGGPHLDPVASPSAEELETVLVQLTRPWRERVRRLLIGEEGATADDPRLPLLDRFPVTYREATPPRTAVADLRLLVTVLADPGPALELEFRPGTAPGAIRLVAAKRGTALELSAFLPIVESLGLTVVDEIPHRLDPGVGEPLTLHDFGLRAPAVDVVTDGPRLADAITAAWRGHLEVDALNRCLITARLDREDVALLRTYRRLRRQLGTAYTAGYVDEIVVGHPQSVRALMTHVHARFDPRWMGADEAATRDVVLTELDALERLDHDRVLRGLLHLVDATLRTNAFRPDARADDTGEPYVAVKFDPAAVPDLTPPLPYREIFVHSPRMEGVHLRGGPVARGGLRWSDRRDDVRSEVLDLLKAQVLKNAVIVPTGAKGGFVVTSEPDDPAELRKEVRRQYVTFVRGLLDITDDLDGDAVLPPPDVVRRDGDDPYLVVAADRGTATLSDTANQVARRYGFWLDDAFASGGSQGYDHKALGVTARGAWVAVRRHARELGLDAERDPLTLAGVGDMSGDVFGNALLRSRSVRLVAAFDHRHIFLDPDPDPEAAFEERQRLFDLPRSSWADYDREVLGPDGLIVPRGAKRVVLTDAIRAALRLEAAELSPLELIGAILRAPVDVLFAGGIGTYVKASTERHDQLGDRANDELRIDATEVRARIVGEGANLFMTQRARIELARRGGRLNQDAVDNAAGVITSDLEVNIKILLREAEERQLLDREGRDALLAALSDDVVASVLQTVDHQTAAISRELARSPASMEGYGVVLRRLEATSDLDRDVEVLPTDDELASRAKAGAGLTRPELATLLAWAKRELKEALLASPVPDAPMCAGLLVDAFPAELVSRFPDLPREHRLRRELIATHLANDVVDRMGVTFAARLAEETGTPLPEVVRVFHAMRTSLGADRWWSELDDLDAAHEPDRVRELERPLEGLLAALTRALLTDPTAPDPADAVERQARTVRNVLDGVADLGSPEQRRVRLAEARRLVDDLVEPDLARLLASVDDLALLPDVDAVRAAADGRDDREVLDALLRLGDELGIETIESALSSGDAPGGWPRRQRLGLARDLRRARRVAAMTALRAAPDQPVADAVDAFLTSRGPALGIAHDVVTDAVDDASAGGSEALAALGVAARAIRETIERSPDVEALRRRHEASTAAPTTNTDPATKAADPTTRDSA